MNISSEQLILWISEFLWPFFRIAAMFMVVTVIGTRLVPEKIRLIFALVVTLCVFKQIDSTPVFDPLSWNTYAIVICQVIIGAALGFVMQLVFQAFVIGGQLIAMQAGLGFASLMDPQNNVSVPVVSQLYLMLITLLYLAMNGHLIMIEVIVQSFNHIPISQDSFSAIMLWKLVSAGSWMFTGGILMALPAVVSLLVVNVGFAVMTRSAPQLNIFTIGFPVTLTLGLLIIFVTLPSILTQFDSLFYRGLELVHEMLRVRS